MQCHDNLSGEDFEIEGLDIMEEIKQWVADGIDMDSGTVEFDVDTESGGNYRGEVDPTDYCS